MASFKCGAPNCNQSFQLHKSLLKHTASAHSAPKVSTSSNAFKCGVLGCGKSFPQLEHLKQHGISHSATKTTSSVTKAFKCGVPDCGQSFYDHGALLQHGRMTSHSSAKSTKPFISATGNKPYKCGVPGCGQSFDDHPALLRHGKGTHPVHPRVNVPQELQVPPSPYPYLPPFDGSQTRYTTNGTFSDVPGSQSHLESIIESLSNVTLGYQNTTTNFNSQPIASPSHTRSPPPGSRTPSFFRQPENVDARNSAFNQVGSQINIESVYVGSPEFLVNLTPGLSSPPPPYQQ